METTMPNTIKDYESLIENAASQKDAMKLFSKALAQAELELGITPKHILVNGIVKNDEITASFEIDKTKMADLLNLLIEQPNLNPDIIVNGIPANIMRSISVRVGRQVSL